ncbi:Archaellum protein FlaD/E [Methanonatronarchaeum thermophilum]|uniref:Archaellum protein FlaD/E n=1 Tax=Methanonatronarchaeum thermophilum TaxID=1927129 RepID=A0A1Y3GIN9_9EURY|nr:FlaD/FlaE family flagellar protein [Methanonatronarchaeum thermophilum]OUJ19266.1 Archaellum protein FlaD/E [Methanonatronarchaeum thermophilum]
MNFNPLKMLLGRGSEDEEDSVEDDEELFEDEGFDDFDDASDDFDDFDEEDGSSQLSEIQSSIEALETEVGGLSSTISVTKDDIESIGNRVDDVEENVKKLLDVYELVTKDINPFTGGGEDLSNRDIENADGFGVFEGSEGEQDFSDDFLDEDDDFLDEEDDVEDLSEEDDDRQVITPDDFDEDVDEDVDDFLEEDVGSDSVFDDEDQGSMEEIDISEEKLKKLEKRIEMLGKKLEAVSNGDDEFGEDGSGEREYYLEEIKRDYYSDIVLMNWTNFLLTMVDTTEFRQILDVYVDLKWISPEVRDYVERFEESISTQPIFEYGVKASKSGTGNSSYSSEKDEFMKTDGGMTVEDHTRSLIFISKLRDDEDALSEKNVDKLKKEIDDILKYNLEI